MRRLGWILIWVAVVGLVNCSDDDKPVAPTPSPIPVTDTLFFDSMGQLTSNGMVIDVGLFGVPDLADIDNDRDLDLFLGDWWGVIWHYENTGSPQAPVFTLAENEFDNINVGRCAAPVFVDIDADGDLDLFVGNMYTVGYGAGGLWFFRNVGSAHHDSLILISQHYLGLTNTGLSKPTFGDIDNDGDLDLVLGYEESFPDGPQGLLCFRNIGSRTSPSFERAADIDLPFPPASGYGQYLYPCLHDLDDDGDLDLLLGHLRELLYYENTGTSSAAVWTLRELPDGVRIERLLGVVPDVIDLNGDGKLDLAIGTGIGYQTTPDDQTGAVFWYKGK